MPIFWDDIEILQVLDECERGERSGIFTGFDLMQTIATKREVATTEQDYHRFVRELFVLGSAGLLTWDLTQLPPQVRQLDPKEPSNYLQNVLNITLTIAGRDRARGQIVRVPWPDPGEDDGHMIRALTLEEIAGIIGANYSPRQAMQLLVDSGVSIEHVSLTDVIWEATPVVRHVLYEMEDGTSGRRRELRGFIGAWLDDRLHTGPSPAQHEKIVRDLSRQGWFVRDGRLVVGEPVRGADRAGGDIARDARIAALHPTITEVSQRSFEAGVPASAVFEAFKAVDNRVQELSSSDDDGYSLMARVFRPDSPVLYIADISDETGRNLQAGYHHMFMGAMRGIRNPHAHGHFPELDENEALEQLGFASLLMRRLDGATWAGDGDGAD